MIFQDIKTLLNKNEMCECKNFENNAIVRDNTKIIRLIDFNPYRIEK